MKKADILVGKRTGDIISPNIYGLFIEHVGKCIYDGIYVGENSDIPNVRGIRKDVVDALKAIAPPVVRWPGGCFASIYHWKDGIGPKENRPRYESNSLYHTIETNQFGTHEFLDLCELIGAEPYICGNIGSGTVQEMAEWVEYITHPYDTPMANLRRKNGREEPWHIKYWGLGNENWGGGGNMRPEYYTDLARRFATFTVNYGEPNQDGLRDGLFKIWSGPHKDNYAWTEYIMKESFPYQPDDHWGKHLMHGLSLHCYAYGGEYFKGTPDIDFNETQWANILQSAVGYDELLTNHSAIMDKYDPEKEVKLIFDEWGAWLASFDYFEDWILYQQNTLRDAIFTASSLNTFNKHADRLHMANLSQAINSLHPIIHTNGKQMFLTPSYYIYQLYLPHRNGSLLETAVSCDLYDKGRAPFKAISVSASEKDDTVFLTLTNAHFSDDFEVNISLPYDFDSVSNAYILTDEQANAVNTYEDPNHLIPKAFENYSLSENGATLIMPSKSVVTLTLKKHAK